MKDLRAEKSKPTKSRMVGARLGFYRQWKFQGYGWGGLQGLDSLSPKGTWVTVMIRKVSDRAGPLPLKAALT